MGRKLGRLIGVAVAALIGGAAGAADRALSIKGVRLGMTEQQARDVFGGLACNPHPSHPRNERAKLCIKLRRTYGGLHADIAVMLIDGRVVMVQAQGLDSERFDDLLAALKEAYGQPARTEKVELSNRMGARFQGLEATWLGSGGTRLDALQFANDITTSRVMLTDGQTEAKIKSLDRQQAKAAAKDL